jgi:hypothetical protein
VWFTPNEDALGRVLQLVEDAQDSVRFTIFAFTKDQVGAAFIDRSRHFRDRDLADGVDPDHDDFRRRRSVAGVIDQSQLHSNGQYHEVYRMLGAGLDLRMDGIDSSKQPGDYQAGGGRLHSKTMVLDAHGKNPITITGSFNWSSSATQSNDEYLLIFHGARVTGLYDEYFESLWANARHFGSERVGENGLKAGDIVINEVMWYGAHDQDADGTDEFIELRNLTDRDISLDMWQIGGVDDFVVGLPPGSTIPAGGLFSIVDHVLEPYQDGAPQDEGSAYTTGDLVVNSTNDNRLSRLYLKDTALELKLLDPDGTVMDLAGDGGIPFAGGPEGAVVRSMERRPIPGNGTDPASWKACSATQGGENVRDTFRSFILATPGEENSP